MPPIEPVVAFQTPTYSLFSYLSDMQPASSRQNRQPAVKMSIMRFANPFMVISPSSKSKSLDCFLIRLQYTMAEAPTVLYKMTGQLKKQASMKKLSQKYPPDLSFLTGRSDRWLSYTRDREDSVMRR